MNVDTLQDRLDQLQAGETFKLDPPGREFKGPLVIRRATRIEGQGGTIWAATGPILKIEVPGVELCDLNLEVTSRDAPPDGDESVALMVGPLVDVKMDNVSVRGNVHGLPQEEGAWQCPKNLQLGTLRSAQNHEFQVNLITPVACTLESAIDGLVMSPRDLPGGPATVTVKMDPMPSGTRLRGDIFLRTKRLTRRIKVAGQINDKGNVGNGQILWRPEGDSASAPFVVPSPIDDAQPSPPSIPNRTVPVSPLTQPVQSSDGLIVSPMDGPFRTIGEALQQASNGSRIRVKPGIYKESLRITKKVEIIGEGLASEVVVESSDGNALLMKSDLAKVRGMTFRSSAGQNGRERYAVNIPQGQLIMEDCTITSDTLACVAVTTSGSAATLKKCRIQGGTTTGILVADRAEAQLDDCDITQLGHCGVESRRGSNVTMRGCRVSACNQVGLLVHDTGKATVDDCDFIGNALAGIEVRENGMLTMRKSKVRENKGPGARIHNGGQATIDETDLSDNGLANLEARQNGQLTVRRSKMARGKQAGVLFGRDAVGLLEDCIMTGNAKAAVEITQNANPTLRRCTIRDCSQVGLAVRNRGRGVIEDCDLSDAQLAVVEVRQNSTPAFKRCKIHDSKRVGFLAAGHGGGTLEECEIFANIGAGVAVATESNPSLKKCQIRDNGHAGAVIWEGGRSAYEKCEITGNASSGIAILAGGSPTAKGCRIGQNEDAGIWAARKAEGTIDGCDLTENKGGAIDQESGATTRQTGNKTDK